MNQADTLCHRPNSAVRNICLRAVHHSSFKFQPSSAPLSPQTPSLPVPRPANDATREKQIPFRNQIQLDFGAQGIGGNRNSNVGDGYYELAVDMDGNGSFETKQYFHRLLGDVDGNGVVDNVDKSQVLSAQGAAYSAENDINGDGGVNVADTSLLARAFGRKLKSGLPRND